MTHLFLLACRISIGAQSTNRPISTCAIDGIELRLKEKVYQGRVHRLYMYVHVHTLYCKYMYIVGNRKKSVHPILIALSQGHGHACWRLICVCDDKWKEERPTRSQRICFDVWFKLRDLNRIEQSGSGSLRLNKPIRTAKYTTNRRAYGKPELCITSRTLCPNYVHVLLLADASLQSLFPLVPKILQHATLLHVLAVLQVASRYNHSARLFPLFPLNGASLCPINRFFFQLSREK